MKTLLCSFVLLLSCAAHVQIITTVVGGDSLGLGDGDPATACELYAPISVAFDVSGNLYITDMYNNRIRKVATDGIITTIIGGSAGYGGDNGLASAAQIWGPYGIAIDAEGNIFFSDLYNHRIRRISHATGIITTIAGTGIPGYSGEHVPATSSMLNYPGGIAVDKIGNVYVAEVNNRVQKIDTSGFITTIAGVGYMGYNGEEIPATTARLDAPTYVAVDKVGNIYIADNGNSRVRRVDTLGIIHAFAGGGVDTRDNVPATDARQYGPAGLFVDDIGNVYTSDVDAHVVRKIDLAGIITTVAGHVIPLGGFSGDGGPATMAELNQPVGIVKDAAGNVYIADANNNRIRRVASTVSVPQIMECNRINAYPNPSSGNFTVNVASAIDETVTVKIIDVYGVSVKTFLVNTNTSQKISLSLPDGMYLLVASTPASAWTKRIIIAN